MKNVKFWLVFSLILALSTLVLLEMVLRILPAYLKEPQRSLFEELMRLPQSNTRVYRGVVIPLPQRKRAEAVVVGDSFPYGTYVEAEDTFPAILEHRARMRVANLGVGSEDPSGYNRMIEVGLRYHPGLVIYCVFVNDFVDVRFKEVWPLHEKYQYAHRADDEDLFYDQARWPQWVDGVRKKITNRLISFQIVKMLRLPSYRMVHVPRYFGEHFFLFAGRDYWDPALQWNHPEVQRGVDKTVAFIQEAARFLQGQNIALLVVIIPNKEMVYGPLIADSEDFYDSGFDQTLTHFEQKLNALGIPNLNLTPRLIAEAKSGQKLYFSVDGHFNEAGHQTAAKAIADYLSS